MAKYLKNITSYEDLKHKYRELIKVNHPDAGGSVEVMQEINHEYDALFKIWKDRAIQDNTLSQSARDETAESTRMHFYTANGWAGSNYDTNLGIADISKIVKNYVKEKYPTCKFSVRLSRFSMGQSLDVTLKAFPEKMYKTVDDLKEEGLYDHIVTTDYEGKTYEFDRYKEEIDLLKTKLIRNGYLNEDTWTDEDLLQAYKKASSGSKFYAIKSDYLQSVVSDVDEFVNSYNYHDCDSMQDYFNVNFWYDGVHSDHCEYVPKTARIAKPKEELKQTIDDDSVQVNEEAATDPVVEQIEIPEKKEVENKAEDIIPATKVNKEATSKCDQIKSMIHDIGLNYSADPSKIAELMAFSSKFYKYSLNNTMLIQSQMPHAVYVQSFEAWKKMGVHVKAGEHGLKVLVPVKITYLKTEDGLVQFSYASEDLQNRYKAGLIEGFQKTSFKAGNVFDISQTNYPPERYPELFSVGYTSREHGIIADALEKFSESKGCPVSTANLGPLFRGYYRPSEKVIVINEDFKDTQRLSTLSHELGHFLCDHKASNDEKTTSQREFEADCVSIIIQSYFDIDITDTRKQHLADHYSVFVEELKGKNPDLSPEDIKVAMDDVYSAAYTVFKDNVEAIDLFVNAEFETQTLYNEEDKDIHPEAAPYVSYDVVECSEYPDMANIYSKIESIDEAIDTFKALDSSKKSMVPGINMNLSFDSFYNNTVSIPLLTGKRVDLTLLEHYGSIVNHPNVITELKNSVRVLKDNAYEVNGKTNLFNIEDSRPQLAKAR